jgi:hypothetical protein
VEIAATATRADKIDLIRTSRELDATVHGDVRV